MAKMLWLTEALNIIFHIFIVIFLKTTLSFLENDSDLNVHFPVSRP